jgi:hypothetical protein
VYRKEITMGSKKSKEQISAEADAFADVVVAYGVETFKRKDREKQFQQEVAYTQKRALAWDAKDSESSGRTWTDKEFSEIFNAGYRTQRLAQFRRHAMTEMSERADQVLDLIKVALAELPLYGEGDKNNRAIAVLRAAAALSETKLRSSDHPMTWTKHDLCAVCDCNKCQARIAYLHTNTDVASAPSCCYHKWADLYLPF